MADGLLDGHAFDLATAVRGGPDRWETLADGDWGVGDRPNGGYLLALATRTALEAVEQPHPIAVSGHFLAPPVAGSAELAVTRLRAGRSLSAARVTLVQEQQPRLEALVSAGTLDPNGTPAWRRAPEPPALPPVAEYITGRPELPNGVRVGLLGHVDIRVDPATTGWVMGRPSGRLEMRGWVRFRDGRGADSLGLLQVVDALPPASFELGIQAWAATVELTVYVRCLPARAGRAPPPTASEGSGMRVFVAGGTGAVGGHVIPALVQEGHTVTALARTPEKAARLTAQGATAVSVSLFDRAALAAMYAGQDAVINLASAIPPMSRWMSAKAWRNNDRVRTQGSAAVVDAALAAGVDRVVQESVSMLYRDQGPRWVDEDAPIDRYPMARGNLAAEANAHRFSAAGGTGVVVRFGWFYGPGAAHSEQLLAQARRHLGLVLGPPSSYVSSIHVADAAAAVAAALHAPAGTFNIVDDEPLTKRAYAEALARAAGKAMWLRVPGRAGLLFGDRLTSLTRSLRVSNARLRAATRWAPRYPSAREGWIATATALNHRRITA